MTQVIPKSRSRKVNGYVKAVLALEAVRRKREDRYDRYVRPLDRKRDRLVAEVEARRRVLTGGQHAGAQWLLRAITTVNSIGDGSVRYEVTRQKPQASPLRALSLAGSAGEVPPRVAAELGPPALDGCVNGTVTAECST